MKRFSFLAILFVAIFAMVMSAPLNAQGMTKSGGNQKMMNSQKDAMWNNQYSQAKKLDSQSMKMNKDFQELQNNFQSTMNMDNMSGIKQGLKKQESMMKSMEPMIAEQQKMSKQLMSMVDKKSQNNMASDSEMTLAKDLSNQTEVVNEDYKSMQNDLGDMLKMNNMSDLKQAMQQHYHTMENMSQMMNSQQDMAGNMMAMMNGNNMGSGMMQKNGMGQSGMKNNGMDPNTMSKDSSKTKSGKW